MYLGASHAGLCWRCTRQSLNLSRLSPSARTTSFSFSTASAKRATSLSRAGMSSTSMAALSGLSDGVVGVIAPFPWPLVKTHDWSGNPEETQKYHSTNTHLVFMWDFQFLLNNLHELSQKNKNNKNNKNNNRMIQDFREYNQTVMK